MGVSPLYILVETVKKITFTLITCEVMIMKKICILLACALLLVLAGCKKKADNTENTIKIGISKIILHPALDAIEQGIKDELAEAGFTNIVYDSQNANGEIATASSIANLYKQENMTVSIGIATPMALALANQIKDKSVVFSAVSDPIGAGIRSTLEAESGNITGVSDMAPVRQQILLITKLKPGIKRIGHIYTPGEANSISMRNVAQETCDELGIELVLSTVTNTSEVKQAATVLAPKVEAIYISNDNTVVAALAGLCESATRAGVPVISADPSSAASSGVTVAYGIDNYQTGRATGKIVARILRGEKPSEIPVKLMSEPHELAAYVDMALIERFGLNLPAELHNR